MTLPLLDCDGCRACCVGDSITIRPDLGDEHKRWKTDFDPKTGQRTLKRTPSGNCIYLGPKGCRIHGKQPAMCRAYDCRIHYLNVLDKEGEAGVAARLAAPNFRGFREGKRRVDQTAAASAMTALDHVKP